MSPLQRVPGLCTLTSVHWLVLKKPPTLWLLLLASPPPFYSMFSPKDELFCTPYRSTAASRKQPQDVHHWKCQLAGEVRVCASFGWSKAVESLGPAARGRYDLTLRASLAYAVDSCRGAKENPPCFRVFRAHVMNSHNADFIT